MSGAIDTLSAEDTALMNQMQADDAASAPSPDTAAPAAPEPAATAEPQQQKTVPLQALHEERERRRRLEADLAQERTKAAAEQAKLTERFDLLRQAAEAHLAQPKVVEPPEPAPDFATDPAGFIKHGFKTLQDQVSNGLRGLEDRLGKVETGATKMTETQQQQQLLADLQRWGSAQEAEFAQQTPDYLAAMNHLKNTRVSALRRMGVAADQIEQHIMQEAMGIANHARQTGRNFGELLYGIAQDYGYRKSDSPTDAAAGAPAPAANPAERLIRGQEMATTLGATGAAPRGEPGPQHIAEMSDAQFAEYYAKVQKNPSAFRELFGA